MSKYTLMPTLYWTVWTNFELLNLCLIPLNLIFGTYLWYNLPKMLLLQGLYPEF